MRRVGALARGLLIFLAVEIGCYVLIANALSHMYGWRVALLTVIGLALALRVLPGLLSYAIAWTYAEPLPVAYRLGVAARLGYVLAEIAALAAIYTLLHPFAWLLMPGESRPSAADKRRPVLLVHGYLCNRGVWWSLQRWLRARGYAVYTVDLEPVFGDLDVLAEKLAARVEQITSNSGGKLQVIAASMGGLVLRAYLRKHGGARIARAITLASPHHGSLHAWLALGINGRQMRLGSRWLRDLAQAEAGVLTVPVVSIYSCHDNLVAPVWSSRLDAARNVAVVGVGHMSMAFSPRVRQVLAEHLT